jgi:signal transduction histidine kinase
VNGLRLEAAYPADGQNEPGWRLEAVSLPPEGLPALPGATVAFEVSHRGERLGALTLTKRPGEALTPTERRLAAQLAAQAGLVLRNAGLTGQLKERMAELRASRKRIVEAADGERRRLERNIHDGAQQQLVALAVKARLTRTLAQRDPAKATEMLMQIETETQDALENLRDLARGIYPPLLADKGLVAALQAQARKSAVPVTVQAGPGVGRYPQDTEAAAYFCTLEALQNVAKYAAASRAEVHIGQDDGMLGFEVHDDGCGFDTSTASGTGLQGMADRLAAIGGTFSITSEPGAGTTVAGRIPASAEAS